MLKICGLSRILKIYVLRRVLKICVQTMSILKTDAKVR